MPIRTEPYVKVREVIKNAPTAIDADNNSDIGIVMVSGYGPELGRATGPSDFLSKYTIDGVTVPRDADVSFINAYYMSYFAALVISRSTDTTATRGLMYYSNYKNLGTEKDPDPKMVCTTSPVWYKDNSHLDKTSTWEFELDSTSGNGAVAFVVNDTVYYANITKDNLVIMYPQFANYSAFIALSDFNWRTDSSNNKEVVAEQVSDFISSIRASLNLIDQVFAEAIEVKYVVNGTEYSSLSEITTDNFSIEKLIISANFYNTLNSLIIDQGSAEFTSWNEDGSVQYGEGTVAILAKTSAYYKVKVTENLPETSWVGNVYFVDASESGNKHLYGTYDSVNGFGDVVPDVRVDANLSSSCGYAATSVSLDNPNEVSQSKIYPLEISWNNQSTSDASFTVEINSNKYYFYRGTNSATDYKAAFELTNNNTPGQIKTRLESVGVHVMESKYNDGNSAILVYLVADSEAEISLDGTEINAADFDSAPVARFSIRANINAASDYLRVNLDNSIGDNFEVIFNDDTYLASLNPNATDSNEVSIYIDYLNTVDLPFTVEVINQSWNPYGTDVYSLGEPDEANDTMFGKGLGSQAECSKTPYLLKAADKLGDQDQYDLAYLSCAGITKISFVKRMAYIAMNNFWFLPIDVPYDRTSLASIKNYFNALQLNSSYLEAMGPFDRNQSLTGWINYIAASSLFYERLMSNKQNNDEFAPIYKETYGVLNYTNPVKMLTKPQREELLSLGRPVNYVNYNNRTRNYFLNDDWTHQSVDNVMSEEQNRRLVNKINRDIRHNMDQFIGKQNNAITRSQVVDMINYYMTNEIMTKSFAPEAYEVICNKKNNTDDIIRAKQLKVTLRVRLYNSIKYIDVLDEVYPIGVEFEG